MKLKFFSLVFEPFKWLLWLVGFLFALVIVLLLTLPIWIKPMVCNIANSTIPGAVKVGFQLNDFGLNYYTGKFNIGEMQLDNPEGYDPVEAVKLGDLSASVDMPSVFTDVIHVEKIELRDFYVSYVDKDGVNNFDAIAANLGIEEAPEEIVEEKDEKKGFGFDIGDLKLPNVELEKLKKLQELDFGKFKLPKKNKEEVADAEKEEKPPKKVIIDQIRISGITFRYGKIAIPLPPVTLKDIGKESGGVDWSDAANEIWRGIMSAVFSTGAMLQQLGESALNETKAQLESAKAQLEAAKAETEAQLKAAREEAAARISEATDVVSNIGAKTLESGTQTLDTTFETGSKALDSTIDLGKGIGESTIEIGKGTVEDVKALGKGAEKLGKDLFKMLKK